MAPEAQLEWEARAGRLAAYAAFAAVLLPIAGGLYLVVSGATPRDPRDRVGQLTLVSGHSADFVIAGAVSSLGIFLLAVVFHYLYRAVKHRKPEVSSAVLVLAVAGPLALALATLAYQLTLVEAAGQFAASGPPTEPRAEALLREGPGTVAGNFSFGARLAFGLAVVLVSLNAMRVGLLSRFMGILGIIIGILHLLVNLFPALGGPQFLQVFWVAALGLLFLGRWPGGRGPAWQTGEATPWPTAADRRAEVEGRREEHERSPERSPAPYAPELETPPAADGSEPSGAWSPAGRRKRKRRR